MDTPPIIVNYAEVIQTSLAPVFLLAGTAALVGIYCTRLGRVSDRLNEVIDTDLPRADRQRQLIYLRRRTLVLEIAVILGVVAGICTCGAILNLLSGALAIRLQPQNIFWFFGGAIISLMLSLVAFLFELLAAGRSILIQIQKDRDLIS
ncbi:DUF2721 domain-containing protein (plasmid) [Rhizobium grahamii]|uniref:DUF2721 domain-containing protein n=1 Tax=Rhizobium grahamii TaxID=1120045 RepID=A0A5Q0CGX8_9HYPH|nr:MULTISPECIES: DUF2721 domain-containing protein [Rhizobium]QFY63279.1 DUF2721 domain-containing protein [Rhizobium grahamii]QRM51957.1 DUF2721 domain-containing protein [Rhizobium sp. BG6]